MKKTHSSDSLKERNEVSDTEICAIAKGLSNNEMENKEDIKEPAWKRRYVITIVGFLIFLIIHIQRTAVNVLIVAMVNNTAITQTLTAKSESCMDVIDNSTELLKTEGELLWSPRTQGYILGTVNIGHIFVQIPAGRLAERYGCKWFLVWTVLISSLLTVLIPPFSWISSSAVIVIQIIRGIAMGANYPCVSILVSNWSPKSERGFLFSIIVSALSLGVVVGSIIAGYVSDFPGGWPYAYYIIGGSGLILGVYGLFFISENPSEDRWISKAELNFILKNQENALSRKRPNLPWRKILTSVPVYAMIFAVFGRFWAMAQISTVHATFLGTILHFPMGQNGLFSAIPNLLSFISSTIASWISLYIEKKKIVSTDFLRKFWTLTSSVGYSLCLFGMYLAGCDRKLSVIFATLSLGSHGVGNSGSQVVVQDVSPVFSGTLHSINLTVGFFASLVVPLLVGYLTNEMRTIEQWNKVFFISIGVVMSSAITFVVFGSGKIQPWNFVKDENEKKVDEGSDENKLKNEKCEETTRF